MAQKLLACDFDNTLAFQLEDGTAGFRADDMRTIARWRAAGNVFAVDSGRTLSWLTPVVECEWSGG